MVEESTAKDLVLLRLCNQKLKWPIKNKNECIHVHIVCMSMYIDMIYIYIYVYTSLYVYIENMSIWNIIYSTIVCVYIIYSIYICIYIHAVPSTSAALFLHPQICP